MVAQLSIVSRIQARRDPLARYSPMFPRMAESGSEGDRNSMTKSGQTAKNLCRCSIVKEFHRVFGIHAASGDRKAPFGSQKPAVAPKHTPVPSCSLQLA